MRLSTHTLAVAVLASTFAAPLRAQWEGMSPAERQELMSYKLTMDNINKTAAAGAKLDELSKDPKIKAVMEREEATSLTDAISKMNAAPEIRSIIEGSGLTSKQFMLTIVELASTRAAAKLQAVGGNAAKAAAKMPTSPQNLQFYAAHQAEIEPLAEQLMRSQADTSE